MSNLGNVFPDRAAVPKHRVSALLAAGWARVCAKMGKGAFADALEATEKTVENAMAGRTLPEAHTVFNSLRADETALDEVLASYGFRLTPLHATAANDMVAAAGVINAMGELVKALSDGKRDHNETLSIASLIRPHMPHLTAILAEADRLRGAA